ncbi:GntR family transcriptional regulator [Rhodobacterales bacterium HKCCE2091]|nr:GntR family transcriptional regulator [Rhodobacterales bacterium HKCCE2091]
MARIPLYKTAETEMRRRIAKGTWPPGTRLGNEFQLAEEFGVSQGTMRRALMTLEAEGLLSRKPGRGTLVAEPGAAGKPAAQAVQVPEPVPMRFYDEDGDEPAFDLYRAKVGHTRAEGEDLALFGKVGLHRAERMWKRGPRRSILEDIVLPETLVGGIEEEAGPELEEILDAHGLSPVSIDERSAARLTTMSESVALSCDRNTALLVLTRVARDAKGQPMARQMLLVADEGLGFGG